MHIIFLLLHKYKQKFIGDKNLVLSKTKQKPKTRIKTDMK